MSRFKPTTVGRLTRNSVVRYGLASLLPRGTAILTALALAPLGIEKLGTVQYGYWILATQIPNLVVSPDLGLGQGVINEIAEANRRDGFIHSQRRRLIGLVKLLRTIALTWFVLGVSASFWYAHGDTSQNHWWNSLFVALVVSLGCFVSGIPATVWQRTQLAQEKGHVSVLWEGAGKIITLIACVGVLLFCPNLVLLVIAYVLPPTIALWLNAAFYTRKEFGASPSVEAVSLKNAYDLNRHLFSIGGYFVLLQVCWVVGVAADPFLINSLQSTEDVTYINVMRRPYDMLPLVISLFSTSMWPVLARMHGDKEWARLRRLTLGTAALGFVTIGSLGLVVAFLAGPIYAYLGRGEVVPTNPDLLFVTVQVAASGSVLVLTTYLNSISVIGSQVIVMAFSTIIVFVAKFWTLSHLDIHSYVACASGVYVVATAIPILLLALWHLPCGRDKKERLDLDTDGHSLG